MGRRDGCHFRFKLRANRRNNSQHCCANNVGSCWVTDATTPNTGAPTMLRVVVCVLASGMQTDATTPNIVAPTTLGVVAFVLAVECKRMQQLPTMLGPAVHRQKDATHKTLETMRTERAWPQQCWKTCTNGSNIAALRFSDHERK